MKTIIAGSRTITNYNHLLEALEKIDWKITEVVSGGALGADALGEEYAKSRGQEPKIFEADWDRWGRFMAGRIRNGKMARYGDALILLWDGKSTGSKHMLDLARENDLKILVHIC